MDCDRSERVQVRLVFCAQRSGRKDVDGSAVDEMR